MAANPLPIVLIIVGSLVFQAVLFGDELVRQSFPNFDEPEQQDCDGFFDGVSCLVRYIGRIFSIIWGVIVLLFNLITFGVPGAPWFVRVIFSAATITALSWSIATLIRGN